MGKYPDWLFCNLCLTKQEGKCLLYLLGNVCTNWRPVSVKDGRAIMDKIKA